MPDRNNPQPRDLEETFKGTLQTSPLVVSALLMPTRLDAIRAQAAAYPEGDLAWLLARHDAAQATVRELGYKLDSAGHEWFETEKERDAARADLATLRRLALDAVNAVGLCPCHDPDGDCAKIRALSDALPPEDE